jgi:Tat protein translocase TatB subunit
MPDILFILLLALVIFGPKKLPEIARQIAKYMAQFRQMSNDFKRQLESEMLRIELDEKQAPSRTNWQLPIRRSRPNLSRSLLLPEAVSSFLNVTSLRRPADRRHGKPC